jgi:hypothetical protein
VVCPSLTGRVGRLFQLFTAQSAHAQFHRLGCIHIASGKVVSDPGWDIHSIMAPLEDACGSEGL